MAKTITMSLFEMLKTPSAKPSGAVTITNQQGVADAIATIGQNQARIQQLEAEMNEALAELLKNYVSQAAPIAAGIESLRAEVVAYSVDNPHEMFGADGTGKFVGTGWVRVESGLVRVTVAKGCEDEAVMELEERELQNFVRRAASVNKAAIRANPDALPQDLQYIKLARTKDKVKVIPQSTKLPV